MSQSVTSSSWIVVMAASMAGFGLLLAPAEMTKRIRAIVRDGSLPGLWALEHVHQQARKIPQRLQQAPHGESPNDALVAERDAWEQRCRALQAANVMLTAQLDQIRSGQSSPFLAEPGTPLFVPELLDANVIGAEAMQSSVQRVSFRRIVDAGAYQDVVPSDFVVGELPDEELAARKLIDQGTDSGLHPDQPVFLGRCVVGKVGQVGRWTSTIIPLTDPEFRGSAQLIRSTPQGPVLGPEGVLAGDGSGRCRLLYVASTEPVSVGDEVYTSRRLAGLPVPMYYGQIVEANLTEGSPNWEIIVRPAESLEGASDVQVLRSVLNSARTASHHGGGEVTQ